MKNRIFPLFVSLGLLCFLIITFFQPTDKVNTTVPTPTDGQESRVEEGADSQDRRKAWIESMHRTAPGTDWRVLENDYRQKRLEERKLRATSRGGFESLADGQLEGFWKERGSRNQAGSVLVTDYDVEQDKIYTISAGGTLWKGGRNNEGWEVVNDDIRLDNQFFKIISDGQGGKRLLAAINGMPHYSDDDGKNWTKSRGVLLLDENANSRNLIVLADSAQTIYMMTKTSYWNRYKLFRSTDHGLRFSKLETLESHAEADLQMIQPTGTNAIYMVNRYNQSKTTLSKLNLETSEFEAIAEDMEDLSFGQNGRANLAGAMIDNQLTFYSYQRDTVLMRTTDNGTNWEEVGIFPKRPWGVGMYILPSNPEVMIFGEVDLYKSLSGGDFWDLQNSWGEYYRDPTKKLHADMMYFAEYTDPDGKAFLLISNHGGLNISYDELGTTPSISVDGLNVGQFYDVVTDPLDSRFVYGGTQDQGFQRAFDDRRNEELAFDQVISGDYGHLTFGRGGQTLWMVYPDGWITHYSYPQTDGYDNSWSLTTRNRSAWIPPMMSDPNPNQDIVYLAGGDDEEQSQQSFIFKLEHLGNSIVKTKLPFDFQKETDGDISALEMSLLNTDKWYASTSDGRFFYSVDRGINWEQTIDFVPGGHYLYGATILASSQDEQTVYYAGSGYSNPAVYKSVNGGESFTDISTGLPPTLVFELASNADESMLFAATEAGPFVYIPEDNRWYDMTGSSAPAQTYWSVEYVADRNLIRFGTYGRGIWDFAIDELVSTQPVPLAKALRLSPNPSRGQFQLELPEAIGPDAIIELTSLNGQQVAQWSFEQVATDERHASITVNDLPVGTYIVSAKAKGQLYSGQLVLIAQ